MLSIFSKSKRPFEKTNYITFSHYLLIPIYGHDMSENDFLTMAAIVLDFFRHLLLSSPRMSEQIQIL